MSGDKEKSGCDPDTLIHDHKHRHSLACLHKAFMDETRGSIVYYHDGEFHENCNQGHSHHADICLKHEFTKVAGPDEDCSQRKDCHVHFREDGTAEVHHPPEEESETGECRVVNILKPLN